MGSCLSKKSKSSNGVAVVSLGTGTAPELKMIINGGTTSKPTQLLQTETENQLEWGTKTEMKSVNQEKEISVIRDRKSQAKSPDQQQHQNPPLSPPIDVGSQRIHSDTAPLPISVDVTQFRTSSCTKEEVDAILIQCGRLSRSSSGKATASSSGNGRKYSGSKRSFDFDHSDREALAMADDSDVGAVGDIKTNDSVQNEDGGDVSERRPRHRQRNRQSPRPSPSRERRRTPSRERDQSSQRERRISRSPGRRSTETSGNSTGDTNNFGSNGINGGNPRKPAKLVSIPATVPLLTAEKINNGGDPASAVAIKRISAKRNGGEATGRAASSPRSQSPARTNANGKVADENLQQHQPPLSRSSSRKEQSPFRRNALSEINANAIPQTQAQNRVGNKSKNETECEGIAAMNGLNQKPKLDVVKTNKAVEQSSKCKLSSAKNSVEKTVTTMEEQKITRAPEAETIKPQPQPPLTRSRSGRGSRDLDIHPETLLKSTTSYTNLLLEDIENFHQKNTACPVSLPPYLTKACAILDAVSDLNSTTSSNHSCTFSEDRTTPLPYQSSWKRTPESREPFVESEVAVGDDVTQPSFHKYVTVTRGGGLVGGIGADMDDQESSGSNSFAGSQQNLCSSWEPTSADSAVVMASKSVNSKGRRHERAMKENVRF